jgi:hypothetical protein
MIDEREYSMMQNIRNALNFMNNYQILKIIIMSIMVVSISSYMAIALPLLAYAENKTCDDLCREAKYRCLSQKVKSGDLESQYSLGMFYIDSGDCAEGLKWLKKAALKNFNKAQYQLGNIYMGRIQFESGNCGIKIDSNEAIEWYKKSAESGNPNALYKLGSIYYKSKDMRDNYKHAFHYYKLAAEVGDKQAAHQLGIMYDQGQGVQRDFEEAVKWFNLASENDNPYNERILNQEILKNKLYKTLFAKPFDRLKELSFIEYVIALILTLIGIRLAVKYNREKLPFYSMRGFNLMKDYSSNLKNLEVLYERNKIDNLSITNLIFWNAGRETINNSDIVSSDPLRLICNGSGKFLDAKIIYSNNPSNKFQHVINEDKTLIHINFDYMDKNDGLILQLLHTDIEPDNIEFSGRIKGAGKPKRKIISKSTSSAKSLILNLTAPVLLITMIIAFLLFLFFKDFEMFEIEIKSKIFYFYIFFILLSTVIIATLCVQFIKNRLPKGYKLFLENKIN